jgi:NAD(P)-dependent dehydrogenase (short-subunit alcohol dehydrogenase family)
VNLRGPFLGIKYGAPAIAASGGGVIINMASLGGLGGVPLSSAYGASKAGVINLTQTAAIELRPAGVRVNAICPGPVDTPMLQALGPKIQEITGIDFIGMTVQLQGRLGTPADIARVAAFLASDDAELVNGVALSVDGGMAAKAV